MCGIAGVLDAAASQDALRASVQAMTDRLIHRGPDSAGIWLDPLNGLALGHRRLAVVDLSPAGAQPMTSASGRFVIVLNGEIYNHQRLRADLGEQCWRGHSDTETLLAAIEAWGLEHALQRAIGMFALAVWDANLRTLTLARDRMGEKPLYYGRCGSGWAFASELQPIRALPGFGGDIDIASLAGYLRHGYVCGRRSIYKGIERLAPGAMLRIRSEGMSLIAEEPRRYWSLSDAVADGVSQPFTGDERDAQDELDALLRDVVRLQQSADVPLGAFLSGGVDSSLVVALMQQECQDAVRSFSIGFEHADYDEAPYAAAVARHLGTRHEEAYVTWSDALEVIPSLPAIFDEPFGDSSQIPTLLVSRMARRQVTVCLSGDGGDELFGGYSRYQRAEAVWSRMSRVPYPMRRILSDVASLVPRGAADAFTAAFVDAASRAQRVPGGDRLRAVGAVLATRSDDEFYRAMVSQWRDPAALISASGHPIAEGEVRSFPRGLDAVGRMMFADQLGYLPDDVLTKVDRAAMANSLETRVPLLDHRVVQFAWRLPQSMKFAGGQGKRILKLLLSRYVPDELVVRPKRGFGVPIEHWLRGPLRDWADDLLAVDSLRRDGLFEPGEIRRRWQQHRSGRGNWRDSLWIVLMFQAWRRSAER